MDLTPDLKNMGFSLADVSETDIDDFIYIDKTSYVKYFEDYREFFGEYNNEIAIDNFNKKIKSTFFKKLLLNDEIVGYMNYDRKENQIDDISVRIVAKAQNKGIGTLFVSHIIKLSKEFGVPAFIESMKSNPVQNLYKRLGFELYKESDIIYFFVYYP